MILSSNNKIDFFSCLDGIGLKEKVSSGKSVLVKVNLARTYTKNHPRTDSKLLSDVIEYIYLNNGSCTVAESANGHLREN
jgi:uncharacterized protein (DUF362 family)